MMVGCDCQFWSITNPILLLDTHHPHCVHHKAEDDIQAAKQVILDLLRAMDDWGKAEGGGIHPLAVMAYDDAKWRVGEDSTIVME